MKAIFKIPLLYLVTIFVLQSCIDKQESLSNDKNQNIILSKKIDSIGQHYIDEGKVMGISIAVIRMDDTLYNKGFGYTDSLRTKPVTNKNIFLMASISKLIGSTMVMKLVEEKLLDLDDSLYELLPDYPNAEQGQKITLRHLLSHSSGIQDYAVTIDSIYLKTGVDPTKQDFYDFFKKSELMFEPGTSFSYSNSGYILIAMIVERVTNSSYQKQVDRIINTPNNFNIKLVSESATNPLTSTYFSFNDSILEHRPHWTWIKGDGGLSTTAIELANFPFKWSKGQIITEGSYREMITPFKLKNNLKSGYGLGVRTGDFLDEPVIGHTGGEKSSWAIMKYYREKDVCIVVFVNTDATQANAMTIEGDVALEVLGLGLPDLQKIEVLGGDLHKYTGEYISIGRNINRHSSMTFFQNENDGFLYRKRTGSDTEGQRVFHLGNGIFTHEKYPTDRIVFDFDNNGHVISFRDYYSGFFYRLGTKK